MDISQSHGVEMMRLIIAVALVAIGARTAYYFYVTKKPKGGRGDLGEEVIKPHTPATLDSDIGYFELVIKMYLQGRMSHHFHELQEGDYLPMKGPDPRDASSINLAKLKLLGRLLETLALLLCSKAILENPNDKTNVYLIYANVTFYDILLMEELDNLATIFF
ncbi:hypothetical protein CUMW_165040 [Citrus unshiu]|nr:hypothetical protein CUMW_165040 [Citrus unshiu]